MTWQSEIADAFADIAAECGVSVTYSRGAASAVVTAVIGATTDEQDQNEAGIQLKQQSRDFLITPAALATVSGVVTPRQGDRITELDGRAYQVVPFGGDPGFVMDDQRTRFRIHTQLVTG